MRRTAAESLRRFSLILFCLLILTYYVGIDAASPLDVVINEVAWMGTEASSYDEWIEFYNNTDQDIDLTNWTLVSGDGSPNFTFTSEDCSNLSIPAQDYFLLERTDDTTVNDINADCIYTGSLSNSGEALTLKDPSGNLIDTANSDGGPWPAGVNPTDDPDNWGTMERIDPFSPDTDGNWATNNGDIINGQDANGNPIHGTPKAQNSVTNFPPTANFTYSPSNPTTQDTVQFTDQSSDSDGTITSWDWDFGDGNTSTAQNPTHQYGGEGTYTVTLTVTDDGGATDTTTKQVTIGKPLSSGDCNGDGVITREDANLVAQFALGLKTPTDAQREASDVVVPFGTVDIRDAIAIAEVAQGLRSGFE